MCVLRGGYVAILNFTVYPFVALARDVMDTHEYCNECFGFINHGDCLE